MIERVARALFKQAEWPEDGPTDWGRTSYHYEEQAKAAIKAMREPTSPMIVATPPSMPHLINEDVVKRKIYQAMIDAALEGDDDGR